MKEELFKFKNKQGDSLILSPVMFIVLNIIFFGILLVFVFNSSTGTLVYEQVYAKQIALIVDKAKPGMTIQLDMKEGIELAEKSNKKELTNEEKNKLVTIKDNVVKVKLANQEGYGFEYFSDYGVESYFDKDFLIIIVSEKGGLNDK